MIKNYSIHIHLLEFTSEIFSLFKNTMYNIQPVIFGQFHFTFQIRFHKFIIHIYNIHSYTTVSDISP